MKVLVIGGAGYIGSHVVKAMLKAGHEVTVFDNMTSGKLSNLFTSAQFIAGDTRHKDDVDSAFARGFDSCVYLAAFKAVGESMEKPEKYSSNNICATINILNACVKYNCNYFVFSSSATVYGAPQYLPMDEKHPTVPDNYYGFTKLKIEEFLSWYDKLKGLKFASLRYFNATGYDVEGEITGLETNPQNLLPVIMEVALKMRHELKIFGNDYPTKDGTCIRDYVHVCDLALAHVNALKYLENNKKSITLNLGTGEGHSVLEILETARKIIGKEIPSSFVARRKGDLPCYYACSKLATKTIGWNPKYSSIETIISSTWNVYSKLKV